VKISHFVLVLVVVAVGILVGALLKVGRFKRPNISQLQQEGGILVNELQRFHALSNRFPEHLAHLPNSTISTSAFDVWNGWHYHRRSDNEGEMFKYTGHLRDTLRCRITFTTNFNFHWVLDDESGAPTVTLPPVGR
jgi:hypothetical protein